MSLTARLGGRWGIVGGVLLATLVVGAAWLVATSPVVARTDLQLHDGSAWLVDQSTKSVGYVNGRTFEVGRQLPVDAEDALTIDVMQSDTASFVVADGRVFEITDFGYESETILPDGAKVIGLVGDRMLILGENAVWAPAVAEVRSGSVGSPIIESDDVLIDAVIDGSGTVWATDRKRLYAFGASPIELPASALTAVGDRLIVLSESALVVIRSGEVENTIPLSAGVRAGLRLQQPGELGRLLYAVNASGILRVDLLNGETDVIDVNGRGLLIQPVVVAGCGYSFSRETGELLRACPRSEIEASEVAWQGDLGESEVRLRVVKRQVFLDLLQSAGFGYGAPNSEVQIEPNPDLDDVVVVDSPIKPELIAEEPDEHAAGDGTSGSDLLGDQRDGSLDGQDNHSPVAMPDDVPVGATGTWARLTANDVDQDGDPLDVILGDLPAGLAVTVLDGGEVFIRFRAEQTSETFEYRATDGGLSSQPAVVTVRRTTASSSLPQLKRDRTFSRPGVPVRIDVLANDAHPDGLPLVLVGAESADGLASVRFEPDGTVVVVPDVTLGDAQLTVACQITDGKHLVDGTLIVDVRTEELAPEAFPDHVEGLLGQTLSVDVLANDRDPDGQPINLVELIDGLDPPTAGAVSLIGSIAEFTAAPGFEGSARIAYRITDAGGMTARSWIRFRTAQVVDSIPVAVNDRVVTSPGVRFRHDVVRNDRDADGDPLRLLDSPNGPGYVVQVFSDTELEVTTTLDSSGLLRIPYRVTDGTHIVDGTLLAAVSNKNNEPVVDPFVTEVELVVGGAKRISLPVSDPDSDPLEITLETDPSSAAVEVEGTALTIVGEEVGVDTLSFVVSDGRGGTASGQVQITVNSTVLPNEPPVPADDSVRTVGLTPVEIEVLANDIDPEGLTLTVTAVDELPPGSGRAEIIDGRSVRYTPSPDVVGSVIEFGYAVVDVAPNRDTDTQTALARVTVQVGRENGPNRPPIAGNDPNLVNRLGQDTFLNVLRNDTDPDPGDTAALVITAVDQVRSLSISADGKSLIAGADMAPGEVIVSYTVEDPRGAASTAEARILTPGSSDEVVLNTGDFGAVVVPPRSTQEFDVVGRAAFSGDPSTLEIATDHPGAVVRDGKISYTAPANKTTDLVTYTLTGPDRSVRGSIRVTIGSAAARTSTSDAPNRPGQPIRPKSTTAQPPTTTPRPGSGLPPAVTSTVPSGSGPTIRCSPLVVYTYEQMTCDVDPPGGKITWVPAQKARYATDNASASESYYFAAPPLPSGQINRFRPEYYMNGQTVYADIAELRPSAISCSGGNRNGSSSADMLPRTGTRCQVTTRVGSPGGQPANFEWTFIAGTEEKAKVTGRIVDVPDLGLEVGAQIRVVLSITGGTTADGAPIDGGAVGTFWFAGLRSPTGAGEPGCCEIKTDHDSGRPNSTLLTIEFEYAGDDADAFRISVDGDLRDPLAGALRSTVVQYFAPDGQGVEICVLVERGIESAEDCTTVSWAAPAPQGITNLAARSTTVTSVEVGWDSAPNLWNDVLFFDSTFAAEVSSDVSVDAKNQTVQLTGLTPNTKHCYDVTTFGYGTSPERVLHGEFCVTTDAEPAACSGQTAAVCSALIDLATAIPGLVSLQKQAWTATADPCGWQGITCSGGGVESIELAGRSLDGTLPTSIGNLVDLSVLDLSGNQLSGSLPPSLGGLVHLTELRLSTNGFTGSIPPEVGRLAGVRYVSLDGNTLVGDVPDAIATLKLDGLRLCSNAGLTANATVTSFVEGFDPQWNSTC